MHYIALATNLRAAGHARTRETRTLQLSSVLRRNASREETRSDRLARNRQRLITI
jgi:hypothetical protein